MMKITWTYKNHVPEETLSAHVAHAHRLGLPQLGCKPVASRLAVVGGAPDLAERIEELKAFDGEIWAINGAWRYLQAQGIDATFYATDAHDRMVPLVNWAERAVMASCVPPMLWNLVRDAEMFDLGFGPGEISHGCSAATAAPHAAMHRGHKHVTFYGCGSCYVDGRSHAYQTDKSDLLEIECGGKKFITDPRLWGQVEFLAEVIRAAPNLFAERSGGLLAALAEYGDYDVIAASPGIHAAIKRETHDSHLEKEAS